MNAKARGYIASGPFNGNRAPQHLQNQIIKAYCDSNHLDFVLSRAEYWISGSTQCQLWAALREGVSHIVFFSLWQLPNDQLSRAKIYKHCAVNGITMHFATERMKTDSSVNSIADLEILIQVNLSLSTDHDSAYLQILPKFL